MQIQLMVGHLIILLQVFKQWGILSNVQQSITINFPISFVNNIFSITASHATSQYEDLVITTISKTGAVFYGRGVQQGQTRYIAIGV